MTKSSERAECRRSTQSISFSAQISPDDSLSVTTSVLVAPVLRIENEKNDENNKMRFPSKQELREVMRYSDTVQQLRRVQSCPLRAGAAQTFQTHPLRSLPPVQALAPPPAPLQHERIDQQRLLESRGAKSRGRERLRTRDVVHEHPLDPTLEGERTGAASATTPLEAELYFALLFHEPAILDISSILLDRGSDPRVEKLLDHGHDLGVVVEDARVLGAVEAGLFVKEWRSVGEVFHDEGVDVGLEGVPVDVGVLVDGDEVGAEKESFDAGKMEELVREGRGGSVGGGEEFVGAGGGDGHAGNEFERVEVRCRFRLNEDGALCVAGEWRQHAAGLHGAEESSLWWSKRGIGDCGLNRPLSVTLENWRRAGRGRERGARRSRRTREEAILLGGEKEKAIRLFSRSRFAQC